MRASRLVAAALLLATSTAVFAQSLFNADLADEQRLQTSLASLRPQRPGVVDAYVLSIALDADPVFLREAGEAARVLERRYDAGGRTLALTVRRDARQAAGALARAVERMAQLADKREDVLILFATSHGHPSAGLAVRDEAGEQGAIAPRDLAALLGVAGFENRLVVLSACYSGIFVPALRGEHAVVVSAASADRSSFGCDAQNDWTFFGDALLNRALRKPQPFSEAVAEARALISVWEARRRFTPSQPQFSMGARAGRWLRPLEARMPKTAEAPVGRSPADAP